MNLRLAIAVSLIFIVTGCSTYITPRYSISVDNYAALKKVAVTGVAVGNFSGQTNFESPTLGCSLDVPDKLGPIAYVRKAFEDELKLAGSYSDESPRVVLGGHISRMELHAKRFTYPVRVSWMIDITLNSSNGKSMDVSEDYSFPGTSQAYICGRVAEFFAPAVQDLIGKVVRSPDFKALVE